jgi:inosine-uridine nucleoside N-ribohydrolase
MLPVSNFAPPPARALKANSHRVGVNRSENTQRVGIGGDNISLQSSADLTTLERSVIEELKQIKPTIPEKILLVTDPNKDPDDLASFPIFSQLEKDGHVKVEGAVTTLGNESVRRERAYFTKGVFRQLGLDIPVAVGKDYIPANENRFKDDQLFLHIPKQNTNFLDRSPVEEGEDLLLAKLKASKNKDLIVVINAGMRDIANIIEKHGELFTQKVKQISIMGGIDGTDSDGHILPDKRAYNNTTDMAAARAVYKKAQELEIPLTVVTKETAYNAAVPKTFYEGLKETKHPVGQYLYDIQQKALEKLWENVTQGIIPALTPDWFIKTFTSLDPSNPEHSLLINQIKQGEKSFEDIWNQVTKLNLYDPINVLAGVLPKQNSFFKYIDENQAGKSLVQRVEIVDAEKVKALMSALSKMALK